MSIDRNYVSEVEKFIQELNKLPKTPAQVKEIAKHERIAKLRDDPEAPRDDDSII